MKRVLLLMLTVLMCFGSLNISATEADEIRFYVATDGSDSGSGTLSSPFKTIERAQKAVRNINGNMNSNITVYIRGGYYFLDKHLQFTEEDSGTNGFTVTYKAYENEKPIISGGREMTGWQKKSEDIYFLTIPDYFGDNFISNVYINGETKGMARNKDYIPSNAPVDGTTRTGAGTKVISFDPELVPYDPEMTDTMLFWNYNWRHYMYPTDRIYVDADGNTAFALLAPTSVSAIGTMYVAPRYAYLLANAYCLMDEPGEMYYDRSEKRLYYFKEADENLETAHTIVPYLEKVIDIRGENATDTVKNLTFSGLQFSHSMGQRNYKYGMHVDQSITHLDAYTDPKYVAEADVQFTNMGIMSIANVDNLNVIGNTFAMADNVGLSVYNGCVNSNFEGNRFYDLSDGAMTFGSGGGVYSYIQQREGMSNVAFRKHAIGTNAGGMEDGDRTTDGNAITKYVGYGSGMNMLTVDLEERYSISRVEMVLDMSRGSKWDIEVQASNIPSFDSYEVIGKQQLSDTAFKKLGGKFEFDVYDPHKYRYVRFVKTTNFGVCDVYIYSKDLNGAVMNGPLENITVTNNYIERCVRDFWTTAAIQLFYVKNFELAHNEVIGCPYTAISCGWGWAGFPDRLEFSDIKINYNYLQDVQQRIHDGGGIYLLGRHPNSEIRGNYIKGSVNTPGGIYPDNGSYHWNISENIVEDAAICFHPWAADEGDMVLENNYTNSPTYIIGAQNTYMKNTQTYIAGHMPAEVAAKAELAGLEAEWEHIREGIPEGVAPYAPVLTEDGYPNNDSYPGKYYWNAAYYVLEGGISRAEMALKIARMSKLVTPEYQAVYDALENISYEASEWLLNHNDDIDIYYDYFRKVQKATDEFENCGIFTSDNYDMQKIEYGVAAEEVEATEVVNSVDPIDMDFFIDEHDFLVGPTSATVLKSRDKKSVTVKGAKAPVYYGPKKFGDALFKAKVTIDPLKDDFQGFVFRSTGTSYNVGNAEGNCYIIDFTDAGIEVQRFNNGVRRAFCGTPAGMKGTVTDNLAYGGYVRQKEAIIEFGATNVSDGVRIQLIIDGVTYCDFVDTDEDAIRDPGYVGIIGPGSTVTVSKINEVN